MDSGLGRLSGLRQGLADVQSIGVRQSRPSGHRYGDGVGGARHVLDLLEHGVPEPVRGKVHPGLWVCWDGNRLAYPHQFQTGFRPVPCRMVHSPCHSVSCSPMHSPCHRVNMSDAQSCRMHSVMSDGAQCHFGCTALKEIDS